MARFFYDCEFIENGHAIDLISIGIVDMGGRAFYAVNADMPVGRIRENPWLMEHVWPHLPLRDQHPAPCGCTPQQRMLDYHHRHVRPKAVIAEAVRGFLLDETGAADAVPGSPSGIELWADFAAYDHVCLAQLWGAMVNLPPGIPMFTHDIRQEAARQGLTDADLPKQTGTVHNAWYDAHHVQKLWWALHMTHGGILPAAPAAMNYAAVAEPVWVPGDGEPACA